MQALRPRSLFRLILLALVVVTLPLLAALVTAGLALDALSKRSGQAVIRAQIATKASRSLLEQVMVMERSARQFIVLDDAVLYQTYLDGREGFRQSADTLDWVGASSDEGEARLEALRAEENRLFAVVSERPRGANTADTLAEGFARLTALADDLLARNRQRIWSDALAITDAARVLNRTLLLLAAISLPVSVALGVVFAVLINRPLRRIDRAIRHLGTGELTVPVEIEGGPRDLAELGERLEWLRQRLLTLEEQKVTFLRHVSHELKTPLTAIREGVDLLGDQGGPAGEQTEIAQMVRENSIRLQKLIEDLLQISARSGRASGKRCPVALRELVDQVLGEQELALAAKGLRVDAVLGDVEVSGDPEQLRIVIDNLLSNAVKFSPRDARIGLALRAEGASAIVEVRDAGPGIPAAERERLFEPFVQGQAVPIGPVKGTGLGLAIARDYVEAHHGVIEILDHPGGACLRVTLPRCGPR